MNRSHKSFQDIAAGILRVALLLSIFMTAGCASVRLLPADSLLLVDLLSSRLAMAKEIAWAKWADGLPVRDRAREDAVVARFVAQAELADLNPGAAVRLIRAQIEASCLEQEYWMKVWKEGGGLPPGEPPSLGDLRQRLDRMSFRILAEWPAVDGLPIPGPALKARFIQDGYSAPAAAAAAAFAK